MLMAMQALVACSLPSSSGDTQNKIDEAVAETLAAQGPNESVENPTQTALLSATLMPTATLAAGDMKISEADGMMVVYVPVGEFIMGSPLGDASVYAHEQPQHTVYLDAFWVDQTEVTNEMYAVCVQAGVCLPPRSPESSTRASYYGNATYDDYPVVWVDWYQANNYCEWAGRRLLTEAEWEKAARGTSGQQYPWGNTELMAANLADFQDPSESCALAHYRACEPYGDTFAVGQHQGGASPYGALDMAGNVWEWVADWYGDDYYGNSSSSNPQGPDSGAQKVLRGGSFAMNFSRYLRAAHRYSIEPEQTIFGFGIRCGMDAGT
jgi:serine/threonine-protein kinase